MPGDSCPWVKLESSGNVMEDLAGMNNANAPGRKCILCCERPADTSEHAFKKNVFRELFAESNEKGFFVPDLGRPELRHKVEGPRSKHLQPVKNLCATCNNKLSQPFDRAFEILDRFVRHNATSLVETPTIKIATLFPDSSGEETLLNLKRYFAKAMACYLDRKDLPIPPTLRNLFLVGSNYERLEFRIEISKRLIGLSFIGNSGLQGKISGLTAAHTEEVIRLGIPPEEYSYAIEHGPVSYLISFRPTDKEIAAAGWDALDKATWKMIDAEVKASYPIKRALYYGVRWFSRTLSRIGMFLESIKGRWSSNPVKNG